MCLAQLQRRIRSQSELSTLGLDNKVRQMSWQLARGIEDTYSWVERNHHLPSFDQGHMGVHNPRRGVKM
jgi:hypothetical protein